MTLHLRIDPKTKKALHEKAREMSNELGFTITISDYVRSILNKVLKLDSSTHQPSSRKADRKDG